GHLSNASIYEENPGTEFAILNYSIPTRVFSR
ncbi:MAG TPA: acyloxyacyl hydrolase, partial [Alphaproteobacteria bacterium]|nr:acyloxyacyl hydrolase [Alphaproteobacteria bacterium]